MTTGFFVLLVFIFILDRIDGESVRKGSERKGYGRDQFEFEDNAQMRAGE
jgi:hypothetical protein